MPNFKRLNYRIGDIQLGLTVNAEWEFAEQRPFSRFHNDVSPQAKYQVELNPPSGKPDGDLLFDSRQSWRLYANGKRRILFVGSRDYIPAMVGNFTEDFHDGDIAISKSPIHGGKLTFPLGYPLGELLMTSLLATGYGIMLHSCGVIDNANGIAFAGVSTAGKSTTARLWNNHTDAHVINDDHTILRKINGRYRIYGTPWHGEGGFSLAEDAPLKKIFILKHHPSNHAVRLSPARAAAALLVRTFAPLWSAEGMAFTLQFLDDLCRSVPCFELGFVPEPSAVEYVKCLCSD